MQNLCHFLGCDKGGRGVQIKNDKVWHGWKGSKNSDLGSDIFFCMAPCSFKFKFMWQPRVCAIFYHLFLFGGPLYISSLRPTFRSWSFLTPDTRSELTLRGIKRFSIILLENTLKHFFIIPVTSCYIRGLNISYTCNLLIFVTFLHSN